MKHILTLSLLLCCAALTAPAQSLQPGMPATDSAWNAAVKSIVLELNGQTLERPIVKMGTADRLMLRFDLLRAQPEDFRYRIRHCDAGWQVDDAQPFDFLNGFEEGNVESYANSFTTLQEYVHYDQSLPAEGSDFILSGNYVVEVFLRDAPDSVMLTRRFCVSEEIVDIQLSVDKPLNGAGDVRRDQEVNVDVSVRQGFFVANAAAAFTVQVQQNRRRDAQHTLRLSGQEGSRLLYKHQEANLFAGGNCFRYFDCSNLRTAMYNVAQIERYGGEIFAILTPLEDRSRKAYLYEQTLNGGMKVNVWDRNDAATEADYVEVNFSLPMSQPMLDGNIYIIGDLTDWRCDEGSRMEWRPEYKAYFKRLLLKQGYYAYQLLTVPAGKTDGETGRLEGDHYETPNDYTVFVYLRQPGDRYDRLAGAKVVK